MRPTQHIVISLVVSGFFYLFLRSAIGALACFLSGIFIDLDHFVDYFLNCKHPMRLSHFFRVFRYEAFENVVVFLHSWEWILVFLVFLWLIDWKPVAMGLFVGFFTHLLLDNLVNDHSPLAYFITYRILRRFSGKHFYGEREYHKRIKQPTAATKQRDE